MRSILPVRPGSAKSAPTAKPLVYKPKAHCCERSQVLRPRSAVSAWIGWSGQHPCSQRGHRTSSCRAPRSLREVRPFMN
jgi:hypothetical protein